MRIFLISSFAIVLISGAYPPEFRESPLLYCSSLSRQKDRQRFIKHRSIPDLKTKISDVQLKQVQVVTRHGARAVFKPVKSWPNYRSVADCSESGESTIGYHKGTTTFEFKKKYDLRKASQPSSSCFYKQLVAEGHDQHRLIGKLLADAYFKRRVLFDIQNVDNQRINNKIFFRSTDLERTRISGAELLSSMIRAANPNLTHPKIQLHTADFDVDSLPLREHACSKLGTIKKQAYKSSEYVNYYGEKHRNARKLADEMFNLTSNSNAWPKEILDVLYTAICIDKDLPESWNVKDIKEVLSALSEEEQWKWRYDNAAYSKLSVARFVVELKWFITKMFPELLDDFIESGNTTAYENFVEASSAIKRYPFVLWSSHDTVIAPWLLTFGTSMQEAMGRYGERFPPFASTLIIEVYKSSESPMIRLIYNGEVDTRHIQGCPKDDDLCPASAFFIATNFATFEKALGAECNLKKGKKSSTNSNVESTRRYLLRPNHK